MRHTTYFLIEPLSETRALLAPHIEDDLLALLCAPQSIAHEWADRSAWKPRDSELVAKLTCLADMLGSFPDPVQREVVFGAAEISEELFDRWWSIRRLEHLGNTSDYRDALSYFSDQVQAPTESLAAEWIARQITGPNS